MLYKGRAREIQAVSWADYKIGIYSLYCSYGQEFLLTRFSCSIFNCKHVNCVFLFCVWGHVDLFLNF